MENSEVSVLVNLVVVAETDARDSIEHVKVFVAVDVGDVVAKTVGCVNGEHVRQGAGHLLKLSFVGLGFRTWELWCHAHRRFWLVRESLFTGAKHTASF